MTLPSEIQFQIAEHLRPFEHFYLASVCQQSWNIHGAAIEKHKEIIKSHGSHIFDYDTLVTMADVIQNSTIREKYTTGLTIMGSFWADYSELAGEGGGRLLQALAGTYRSELTCKDEERLLQVCSKAYRDDLLPVGFKSSDPDFPLIAQLLMSLPNLEILGVSFTLGVEQCFHDLMKAALKDGRQFRYLTQVYLSLLPSGYQNHYEIVHIIALLPSMRYIWANQPVSYGGRKMSLARGTSYVKELELYAAGVHLPHLAETLSIFAGLERFTYQQSMSEDLVTNCDARGILRALVDETSDSLLSIHFMGYSPIQRVSAKMKRTSRC